MPLVGGPQILGDRPFADCSSRVRLGNRREVCSCRGEPAPILAPERLASPEGVPLPPENGDLLEGMDEGSAMGGREERFRFSCWSGLVVGAMMAYAVGSCIYYCEFLDAKVTGG